MASLELEPNHESGLVGPEIHVVLVGSVFEETRVVTARPTLVRMNDVTGYNNQTLPGFPSK